jgi:uncharacterized protein (DUF983 family)
MVRKEVGAQCMFEMTEQRANSESCMFFVVVVIGVVVLYSVLTFLSLFAV